MGLDSHQEASTDEDWLSSLADTVLGSGRQTFSLDKVKGNLKKKAGDFVCWTMPSRCSGQRSQARYAFIWAHACRFD